MPLSKGLPAPTDFLHRVLAAFRALVRVRTGRTARPYVRNLPHQVALGCGRPSPILVPPATPKTGLPARAGSPVASPRRKRTVFHVVKRHPCGRPPEPAGTGMTGRIGVSGRVVQGLGSRARRVPIKPVRSPTQPAPLRQGQPPLGVHHVFKKDRLTDTAVFKIPCRPIRNREPSEPHVFSWSFSSRILRRPESEYTYRLLGIGEEQVKLT